MKLRIRRRPPNGRKARRASSVRSSVWPRRAASLRRISTSSGPTSKSVTRCSSPYWRRWAWTLEPRGHQQVAAGNRMPSARTAGAPDRAGHHRRANNVPLRCSADALVALTLALEDGTAYAGDLRANLRVHKDADFGEQLELTLPDDLPIDTTRSTCRSAACSVAPRSSSPRPASNCRSGASAAALGVDDADVLRAVGRFLGCRRLRRPEAVGRRRR